MRTPSAGEPGGSPHACGRGSAVGTRKPLRSPIRAERRVAPTGRLEHLLSLVDAANESVVEPGQFDVWVSDSSTGGLQGSFTITG